LPSNTTYHEVVPKNLCGGGGGKTFLVIVDDLLYDFILSKCVTFLREAAITE